MADINEVKNLAQGFEEFKNVLNERITQLESKGAVDVVTEEKFNLLKADLLRLQGEVTDYAKKNNRVGFSDVNEDVEAHRNAYSKWVRKGIGENDLEGLERKAMNVGSNADGGYMVPKIINDELYQRIVQINPLRSLCDVKQVSTENVAFLNNRKGLTSGWVGETDARSATNTPVIQEIKPTFGELYANPQVTQKLLDDAMFDVEAWLASDLAEEFGRAEAAAFVNGTGTNQPTGFLTGTPVATADATRAAGVLQYVASGSAGALPTDVKPYFALKYALKSQHRAGACFVTTSTTLSALMSLLDTQNRPLWQPSLVVGQPATFIGDAIYEVQDMPNVGAGTFPLAYGNFKAGYIIADRKEVRTLRDPYSNKPYVGFYSTKRVGGIVKDSEAIKLLKASAS